MGRQVLVLLLVGILGAATAALLMLTSSTRFAVRLAEAEADLLGGEIWRQVADLIKEQRPHSVQDIASDPDLDALLKGAVSRAHSILHASVVAPDRTIVAHSLPEEAGRRDAEYAVLPGELRGTRVLGTLWRLALSPPAYRKDYPVAVGDRDFATVRIVLGGTFIWDSALTSVRSGLLVAILLIILAMVSGILFARVMNRKFRTIEQGIRALSEGTYEAMPPSGLDEFDRIAAALNVLGARIGQVTASDAVLDRPGDPADQGKLKILESQTRALSRLGEAAAGMAHELRNQLQVIQLDVDLLRHPEANDPEAIRKHAENAGRGIESLDAAIRGFLKIARLRPPQFQVVRVNELLGEIRAGFVTEAGLAGVSIDLDLEPSTPDVQADPEILRQALQNIIRNALQALTSTEEGRIVVSSTYGGSLVKIAVADNGPGIPQEVSEKVFDLFFTTKADGSGVGLALVRQSIEMHGGHVALDQTADGGTTVVLEIPCGRSI